MIALILFSSIVAINLIGLYWLVTDMYAQSVWEKTFKTGKLPHEKKLQKS